MVDSSKAARKKLLQSQAFKETLECMEMSELLELRFVNKRIGQEIIPRTFKKLRYACPDEDEDKKEFYKILSNVQRLEIENINGTEDHLQGIKAMAEKFGSKVTYLFLTFDGEQMDKPDIAQQYIDVFAEFPNVETLRIEVYEDGNFTSILEKLNSDANNNFPWFEKITTVKCYLVRDLRKKEELQKFFTRFRNLRMIKGVIEEEFDFLSGFKTHGKRVPEVSVTHPETDALRNTLTEFLQYN